MTQISILEAEITGIARAYDNPPGAINELPCFVNFVGPSGTIGRTASRREIPHLVKMQVYVTKKLVAESEALLRPFITLTLNKFDANLSLNNSCQYSMITRYNPGIMEYNKIQYLGIEFDLMAVEHEIISFAK
jgi:hypothetical protein